MADTPETVKAFMARMWTQDMKTISEADYSTLMAIALFGSQQMIQIGGPQTPVPSNG